MELTEKNLNKILDKHFKANWYEVPDTFVVSKKVYDILKKKGLKTKPYVCSFQKLKNN